MNFAGIDFGTTNSYLVSLEGEKLRLAPGLEGENFIPSRLVSDGNELYSIKRYLGRSPEELEQLGLAYTILDGNPHVAWDGTVHPPEDLAAQVFRTILKETGTRLPLRAVLAVPAHYDEAQRRSTEKAALQAGIDVIRLIHEPTAAALAFGSSDTDESVLVFDLGGGTLDLSLLETGGDIFEVMQTSGNRNLGGDDLDLLLAVEIAKKLGQSFSYEVLQLARIAKHQLSENEVASLQLDDLEHSSEMTRLELETIAAPFLAEIEATLQEFANVHVDKLLLVGGMSRMPAVRSLVEGFFGMKAESGIHPEEAVAFGAARYLQILQGEDDSLLLDITPLSLGIETEDSGYSILVPRGSRIPFARERMFSTSRDNQQSVEVNILQGEESDPSDNRVLGRIWLRGIEMAPAGVPEIWVAFRVDESGMLHAFVSHGDREEELLIDLARAEDHEASKPLRSEADYEANQE